jgi:hypothetical protein
MENQKIKGVGKGGKRAGAGRKKGSRDRATIEQKGTLEEIARSYTEEALNVLLQVARSSSSDAARVSAASAILDRGYGKPHQGSTVILDDKRDASDWTRAELVALLGDSRKSGPGTPETEGRGGKPDRVH